MKITHAYGHPKCNKIDEYGSTYHASQTHIYACHTHLYNPQQKHQNDENQKKKQKSSSDNAQTHIILSNHKRKKTFGPRKLISENKNNNGVKKIKTVRNEMYSRVEQTFFHTWMANYLKTIRISFAGTSIMFNMVLLSLTEPLIDHIYTQTKKS